MHACGVAITEIALMELESDTALNYSFRSGIKKSVREYNGIK
jgi:hypothetical protein